MEVPPLSPSPFSVPLAQPDRPPPPAAPSAQSPAPATAPPSGAGESSHELGSLSPSSRGSPTSPLPPFKRSFSASALPDDPVLDTSPLSAKRKRRKTKTRVFEIEQAPKPRRMSTGALGMQGRGMKLANIPNVRYAVDKCAAKEPHIEFLHRLLFNSAGQAFRRKANIRAFSGYVFSSEKERGRCRDKILRTHGNIVKKVAYLLDVDILDSKGTTADAIMAFLDQPKVVEGRGNRADRERREKAEKKKAERARIAKKKAAELKKKKAAEAKREDSDQDGDEDLEFEAKTWVVMAEERELERQKPLQQRQEDDQRRRLDDENRQRDKDKRLSNQEQKPANGKVE